MRVNRFLLGTLLVISTSGVNFGQTGTSGYIPDGSGELLPVNPVRPTAGISAAPGLVSSGTGSIPPATASPTTTLTAPPTAMNYPHGTVTSPWVGSVPAGCCGPTGKNGPLAYELYFMTGPSLKIGGGSEFSGALHMGWLVGGGGKSLLFNETRDAAWVLDLGLSYIYNGGERTNRVLNVFTPSPNVDPNTGRPTSPDEINSFYLRGLHRTSFNFAIGRDWFRNGPGTVGSKESGTNWRVGPEIGGRWGTAHVDLNPVADQTNYLRRSGVYNGVFLGAHVDCEVPIGHYILFSGFRAQWSYDWMNLVPPLDGDLQSLNLLGTIGLRF